MYVQRKDLCVLVDCDKGEGHLTLVARCAEHSVGSSAVARRGAEDLHARALGLLQPFVDVVEQLLQPWKGAQYDVDVLVPPDADVAATGANAAATGGSGLQPWHDSSAARWLAWSRASGTETELRRRQRERKADVMVSGGPGNPKRRVPLAWLPPSPALPGSCPNEGIISRAIEVNTDLLGDRAVASPSSIDDCLDVERRRSVWIKCTGGTRAGQWREVWPYAKECKEVWPTGGTEMVRFRCFEDERHTASGRRTWYDICTVSHVEAHKTTMIDDERAQQARAAGVQSAQFATAGGLCVVCIRSVWEHGNEANFKSGQEELYGLRRAASGSGAQILDEPLKTWAEVQRKLAELARSPQAAVLIISGHGGAAFQGQPDSQTDSAACAAERGMVGARLLVLNMCCGPALAEVVSRDWGSGILKDHASRVYQISLCAVQTPRW